MKLGDSGGGGGKDELVLGFIPARDAEDGSGYSRRLDAKHRNRESVIGYGVPLSHRRLCAGTGHEVTQTDHPGD
jgi:hypothetical protein